MSGPTDSSQAEVHKTSAPLAVGFITSGSFYNSILYHIHP
jgi:hypothetical protein